VEGVTNTLLDQLWESFMGPVIFWPLLADGMYAGISPAANSVASVLSNSAARTGPPQSLPPGVQGHVYGFVVSCAAASIQAMSEHHMRARPATSPGVVSVAYAQVYACLATATYARALGTV